MEKVRRYKSRSGAEYELRMVTDAIRKLKGEKRGAKTTSKKSSSGRKEKRKKTGRKISRTGMTKRTVRARKSTAKRGFKASAKKKGQLSLLGG